MGIRDFLRFWDFLKGVSSKMIDLPSLFELRRGKTPGRRVHCSWFRVHSSWKKVSYGWTGVGD